MARQILALVFILTLVSCHHRRTAVVAPHSSGVQVSGWISDLDGKPYNNGTSSVMLRNAGNSSRTAPMRPDGTFEFLDVAPGSYSISLAGAAGNIAPIAPIKVESADIRNIEFVVPRQKLVRGRIVMNGSGPLPQLRFQLIPSDNSSTRADVAVLSPTGFVTNNAFPASVPIAPMINPSPRPDGSFDVTVLEGNWTLQLISELPSGYSIKSLSYGNAELRGAPLAVRFSDNLDLVITVDSREASSFRVRGRITGLRDATLAKEPISVTLRGPLAQFPPGPAGVPLSATVLTDGSFGFENVLPGRYSALVTGLGILDLAVATLTVGNVDVAGFEIEVQQQEIDGQILVEGGAAAPPLTLSFERVQEPGKVVVGFVPTPSVMIRPSSDGNFRILLPTGLRRINSRLLLPAGYTIRSIYYGTTDVWNGLWTVSKSDTSTLRITLTFSAPDTR